jgi:hypothetical protein
MAQRNPSLFIPFVFENISESRIYRIFDELALGRISRIDIVPRRNTNASGKRFNNVIIRFEYWYENREAEEARRRIENGKEIKIVYYKEYFWKVSAYIPKIRPVTTAPRLILEDEEETKQEQTTRGYCKSVPFTVPKTKQTNNEEEEQLHPNVTVRKKRLPMTENILTTIQKKYISNNKKHLETEYWHDTDDELDFRDRDDENNT